MDHTIATGLKKNTFICGQEDDSLESPPLPTFDDDNLAENDP